MPVNLPQLYQDCGAAESRFSDFGNTAALGLIGASWAVLTAAKVESNQTLLKVSVAFAVAYLLTKGVSHLSIIRHYHKIAEAEEDKPGTYASDDFKLTRWGELNEYLFWIEICCLVVSIFTFFWGAMS